MNGSWSRIAGIGFVLSSVARSLGAEPLQLRFGLYTHETRSETSIRLGPVLKHLEDTLSERLYVEVKIQLAVYDDYLEGRQVLVKGAMDFMRIGAASYIIAQRENPNIQLLVNQKEDGIATFNGMIFTRQETGIQSLGDLKGRSFAFGHRDSTTGSYLSRAALVDAGVYAKDLARFDYHDNHREAVEAVVERRFDAGAAKESAVKEYGGNDLRILHTIPEHIGMPWVARSGLKPEIVRALKEGLLSMPEGGAKESTGFGRVEDRMYNYVRVAIQKSELFEAGLRAAALTRRELANPPTRGKAITVLLACLVGAVAALACAAALRRQRVPTDSTEA